METEKKFVPVIKSGVPLPDKRSYRGGPLRVWPFDKMEVGDSFAVPDQITLRRARSAAHLYRKCNPGWDYIARSESPKGAGRVWRTK